MQVSTSILHWVGPYLINFLQLKLTRKGDCSASKYNIPAVNKQLSNTRSSETFQFIEECLEECCKTHDCAQGALALPIEEFEKNSTQSSTEYPTRLIEVSPSSEPHLESTDVRLVDIESRCPRYMTLSHCWGEGLADESKTLCSNLSERKSRISLHSLSPTFRDAVEIARRVGVRYIWIDALCIIQDSLSDWATESTKMGDIYKNSYLTIAASISGNSSGGCFNQSSVFLGPIPQDPPNALVQTEVSIGVTDSETSTLIIVYAGNGVKDPLLHSPLTPRGWVFQERVLSPRTVHFTPSQVFWECRKRYRREDFVAPDMYEISHPLAQIVRKEGLPGGQLEIIKHWYSYVIAWAYSPRRFTKIEDRLIALSGIARIYADYLKDEYVAGLWKSHMAYGLTWKPAYTHPQDQTPIPIDQRRRPTWSWTTNENEISWGSSKSEQHPDFSLLKTELQYIGQNPTQYNPVSAGTITVKGLCTDIHVYKPEDIDHRQFSNMRVGGYRGYFRDDYPSHRLRPGHETPLDFTAKAIITLIEEGWHGPDIFKLLVFELDPQDKRGQRYLRVGFVDVRVERKEEKRREFESYFVLETLCLA